MNNLKMTSVAAAVAIALTSTAASAITVDGITWDTNAFFDFTMQNNFFVTDVNNVNDEARGVGLVNSINANSSGFAAGELTYVFEGFIASSVVGSAASFTGGTVTFYSDIASNFNALDIATAMDGNVWLELTALDYDGDGDTLDATLFSPVADGFAEILFDVTGGSAAGNFDTNGITTIDGIPLSSPADFAFTGSWQENPNGAITPDGLAHFGTNELKGNSIPEPAPLGLLMLGLGLIGASRFIKASK